MSRARYIGFSTAEGLEPPFTLQDIELVKQDILNALNTRLGERVMRPNFGTRIFDLLMDPFDDETREAIIQDVARVIEEEPRVRLMSVDARELEHVMRLEIELLYVPQDLVELLYIEYDRKNLEAI